MRVSSLQKKHFNKRPKNCSFCVSIQDYYQSEVTSANSSDVRKNLLWGSFTSQKYDLQQLKFKNLLCFNYLLSGLSTFFMVVFDPQNLSCVRQCIIKIINKRAEVICTKGLPYLNRRNM